MRLERYLTEKHEGIKQWLGVNKEIWAAEMWNDYILDDCKPYLKLMKQSGMIEPLFRAVSLQGGIMDNEIHLYSVRQDRKPKGMNEFIFKKFNEWLQKNGHARRDKSVITTPLSKVAKDHGSPRHVYPIGNFKFSYIYGAGDINTSSKVTSRYGTKLSDYDPQLVNYALDTFEGEKHDDALKWLEENTFSTNFKKGVGSGSEIWIECDKYYITSQYSWEGLRQYYKKL